MWQAIPLASENTSRSSGNLRGRPPLAGLGSYTRNRSIDRSIHRSHLPPCEALLVSALSVIALFCLFRETRKTWKYDITNNSLLVRCTPVNRFDFPPPRGEKTPQQQQNKCLGSGQFWRPRGEGVHYGEQVGPDVLLEVPREGSGQEEVRRGLTCMLPALPVHGATKMFVLVVSEK